MKQERVDIVYQSVFIGLFLLMIIPFVILFLYNNPSPEDFYYAHEAKINTLWKDLKDQYRHGTGRYFQNFLLYLTPTFGKSFIIYKAVGFSFFLLLFYGILVSVNLLAKTSVSMREKFLISLVVLYSYLYGMPEVSSGIYWFGGLSAYSSGFILIPLFFQSFLKSENSVNRSARIFYSILTLILLISVIGINEILAILLFLFTLFLNANSLIRFKHFRFKYLLMAISAGIFLYILVKSPGNDFRLTQFPGNRNFYYSLSGTFNYLHQNIISWLFKSPLLVCSLILLPVFAGIARGSEHFKNNFLSHPFWFFILWFGVLFVSIFFSFYSTTVVLNRTSNFIYLIFLAGWFYFLFAVTRKHFMKLIMDSYTYRRYLYPISFVIICLFLLKQNNINVAFEDLFSGSAYNYNRQLNERYQAIEDCKTDSCRVDSLLNIPKTIFYKDITSNPALLNSDWYGRFFNKKSVALKIQHR